MPTNSLPDLDSRCVTRLTELLSAALSEFHVQHGQFLRPAMSELANIDDVLQRDVRDAYSSIISDEPFSDFVIGELTTQIHQQQEFDREEPDAPLVSLAEYSDLNAAAAELASGFCSLPWQYTLLAEFPLSGLRPEQFDTPIDFGSFSLARGEQLSTSLARRDAEEPNVLSFLHSKPYSDWRSGAFYLVAEREGFVADFAMTETLEQFRTDIQALIGLALATFTLITHRVSHGSPPTRRVLVYRSSSAGSSPQHHHDFGSAESELITSLGVPPLPDGLAATDWVRVGLGRVAKALSTDETGRLSRAAAWYFRGRCETDELMKYLRMAVALEILLGDKRSSDLTGITELLANRCAYLLGNDHADRREILGNFRKLYDLRSKIVHEGTMRLSSRQRKQLHELIALTGRILDKEMRSLIDVTKAT